MKALQHSSRVVILTTFARAGYFQRAMRAGVRGFLLKDSPIDELGAALRNVYAGGRAVSPELAITFWETENPLSEREREVLKLAAEGHSAGYCQAVISLGGHRCIYLSEAIQKLEAKNRIDAIGIAQKNGWLNEWVWYKKISELKGGAVLIREAEANIAIFLKDCIKSWLQVAKILIVSSI